MIVETIGVVVALVAGMTGWRHRAYTAELRAWRTQHPVGVDGIVPGAGDIALDAGRRAALLVHGFGDTPQTLAGLAQALHTRGWTVRAPLLPGHGRTLEAFSASRADQWTTTVRKAFEALRASHAPVAIVGLSMGGALATSLAVEVGGRAATLVLLAPFLEVSPRGRMLTAAWPLWALWRPWVPGDAAASIHDPVARQESLGYGVSSPRALRELRVVVDAAAKVSGQLQLPTLVLHSRSDYRIDAAAAARGFARLGTTVKSLRWVQHSGHVITVDRDADQVIAEVVDWLERYAPGPPFDASEPLREDQPREQEGEGKRP